MCNLVCLSLGRRRLVDFAQVRLGFEVVGEVRPTDPLVAHRAVLLGIVFALVHVEVSDIVLSVVFGGVAGHVGVFYPRKPSSL